MVNVTIVSLVTTSSVIPQIPTLLATPTRQTESTITAEPELRKRGKGAIVDVYELDYVLYADYPLTSPFHFAYANGDQWTCKSRASTDTFSITKSFVGCGDNVLTSCRAGVVSDVAIGPSATETCDRYLSCVTIPFFENVGDTSASLSYVKCGSYGEQWYRTSSVPDAPTRATTSSTITSTRANDGSNHRSPSLRNSVACSLLVYALGYMTVSMLTF